MYKTVYCPFCGKKGAQELIFSFKRSKEGCRRFFRCHDDEQPADICSSDTCSGGKKRGCGGIFVHPDCFISAEAQKKRYLLHNNSLADKGYRSFLADFADTALFYIKKLLGRPPHTVFDYGCGNGALVELLASYTRSGLLPEDTEIRGWDPFFAPGVQFFPGGADAVLCLEVAEHFESPHEGFAGLARACKAGGILAVHTLFAPDNVDDFKSWWYKEDPTHVSFYTQKALELCAKRAGFEYCGTYSNCSILRAAFPR
ncbi:class I SAM-dependent methyltransferase [Treponema sp. OMZ 840]|uniref:class I SAM-dependent methyltransferase n=1 Tax=Treponema sp. OMZ 840 TaxID=244313 RepID=UPI003D8D94DE